MRFLFLLAIFFSSNTHALFGAQRTFILHDVDSSECFIQEGAISARKSPYSTFKICLSLIGFDTNILQDTENPLWPFKAEYEDEYKTWSSDLKEKWRAPHSPQSWIKNSCLWYSQVLTLKLGMKIFSEYVTAFGYGNQNLEGDMGAANGLTHAWLGSSLRISPLEQVLFIKRLVRNELPVSKDAQEYTKAILFVEQLPNGMELYGKTGGGDYANGRQEPPSKIRWFVGWVEQGNKRLAFAYMIQATEADESIIGTAAKEELKERLLSL